MEGNCSSCSSSCGYCGKCKGVQFIVLGILILVNIWKLNWGWDLFIGVLLVLAGVVKMIKPACGCCKSSSCCESQSMDSCPTESVMPAKVTKLDVKKKK